MPYDISATQAGILVGEEDITYLELLPPKPTPPILIREDEVIEKPGKDSTALDL